MCSTTLQYDHRIHLGALLHSHTEGYPVSQFTLIFYFVQLTISGFADISISLDRYTLNTDGLCGIDSQYCTETKLLYVQC